MRLKEMKMSVEFDVLNLVEYLKHLLRMHTHGPKGVKYRYNKIQFLSHNKHKAGRN